MPVDKTPWTDDTVMPWGAHEGKLLKDVPGNYLRWLFDQPWIREWPGLHTYLRRNQEKFGEPETTPTEEPQGFASYDDYLRDYRGF